MIVSVGKYEESIPFISATKLWPKMLLQQFYCKQNILCKVSFGWWKGNWKGKADYILTCCIFLLLFLKPIWFKQNYSRTSLRSTFISVYVGKLLQMSKNKEGATCEISVMGRENWICRKFWKESKEYEESKRKHGMQSRRFEETLKDTYTI